MTFKIVSRGTGDLKTRYRPMKLTEMVPTTHIPRLMQIYTDENAGQVHLFEGPSGTGKTTAARIVARSAICIDEPLNRPCLECDYCQMMDKSPDFVEINVANFRKIDDVRALLDNMRYAPLELGKKIYIFDEVHQLTDPSQQVLLKELEEPTPDMLVFLCTTEMKGLKKTLIDRALAAPFHSVRTSDAQLVIDQILELEDEKQIDGEIRSLLIEAAQGSVRAVLNNIQAVFAGSTSFSTYTGGVPAEVPALATSLLRKDWKGAAALLKSDGVKKAGEATRIGLENYLRAIVLKQTNVQDTIKAAGPLGHMIGTMADEPKISQYNQLVLRCLRACWQN